MDDCDDIEERLARAERDLLDAVWRIDVLERAVRMLISFASATDDLLPKRLVADVDARLAFLDEFEEESDPERLRQWQDKREFIQDLAQGLLPSKYRNDFPPMP
jgi:hypothetical protein